MQIFRRFKKRRVDPGIQQETRPQFGFFGDYPSFEAAAADADSYDSETIAQGMAENLQRYFTDEFCEIDGRYQQVHSTLAAVASRLKKGRLSILDLGGGNGNNFVACKRMSSSVEYDWTVLETESMCTACSGRLPITWTSVVPSQTFDLVLISGTLQYLPDPYGALQQFSKLAPWLVIHRTPLISGPGDRMMVQICDPGIHPGTLIPHWFLSGEKLRHFIVSVGSIAYSWRSIQDDPAYVQIDGKTYGFLIKTGAAIKDAK